MAGLGAASRELGDLTAARRHWSEARDLLEGTGMTGIEEIREQLERMSSVD